MSAGIRRLTYSPKVYVFIHSSIDEKVYDVSDHVIGGEVQRLVGQPSKATIRLRNRFFQFSRRGGVGPDSDKPVFLPMDGITIWLQRIAGRPIQVFTGYLDSVPYYQALPGPCTITATCTLKRLQHTYFDPGLVSMIEWFSVHGWQESPDGSGTIMNADLLDPAGQFQQSLWDGGFGNLLRDFLTDIARWGAPIAISDLPVQIAKDAKRLVQGLGLENQQNAESLERLMGSLMTIKAVNKSKKNRLDVTAIKDIYDAASKYGETPEFVILAAMVLSSLQTDYQNFDPSDPGYGMGLFSFPLDTTPTVSDGPSGNNQVTNATYKGHDINELSADTALQVRLFVEAERAARNTAALSGSNVNPTKPMSLNDLSGVGNVIAAAIGKTQYRAAITKACQDDVARAKSLASAANNSLTATNTDPIIQFTDIAHNQLSTNKTWDDLFPAAGAPQGYSYPTVPFDGSTTTEDAVFQKEYEKKVNNRGAAYAWVGRQSGLSLALPTKIIPIGDTIILYKKSDPAALLAFAQWAGSQDTKEVIYIEDNESADHHYRWVNGQKANISLGDLHTKGYSAGYVYVTMTANSKPPIYNGDLLYSQPSNPADATNTNAQEETWQKVVQVGFGTAFVSQFALPINIFESESLGGVKSLENDITVMQGVEQLCTASMRAFMSLPDGSFIAFYPDHFGAYGRKPYWAIRDIEIIDFNIQLNDEALTTHVYVNGGTTNPGAVDLVNEVFSAGVMDIGRVFGAGGFISPKLLDVDPGKPSKGDDPNRMLAAEQAYHFLQRYGARPYRIDTPIIRSHWFEFFYAWQLFIHMWAQQFVTAVEFTFQPELMAGGRVLFADHEIEMYVESVTHTFDYESGFKTTANLSSPTTRDKNRYPGFALASEYYKNSTISTVIKS